MKTVLITGGSRGIGKAMVHAFTDAGYRVAFTYNNSVKEAEALAKETGAIALKADSRNEQEVNNAVSLAISEFGHIDCLVNNAGIASFSLFRDITLDMWNDMLSVNLTGAFLYSKEVLSDMISRKSGRIINITSMWGLVGASCEVHYSAAKAGIIGMTKALAKEVGPSGITVNAIAPGIIDTDMNNSISDEDMKALAYDTPLMRIGKGSDIAKAAIFLASEEASFITGEVMNVSGGYII